MGTHVLPGLEELIESLKDDYAVEEIIGCLGNLGKAAARAAPEIEKAMSRFPEKNNSVQKAGMAALEKIANDSKT